MASNGNVVLSFHDSLLRKSDLYLLEGPRWLNDELIGFAFEYFERVQFAEHESKVAYVGPGVTQFIKFQSGEELGIFLEPLNLKSKEYVFLAVNDNSSCEEAGGSHWSLLMYERATNTFQHFDSGGGSNENAARTIAKRVEPFLVAQSKADFKEAACPLQQNGYDCGLYVICNVEHLCKEKLQGHHVPLVEAMLPATVASKRTELKELILTLAHKST